MVAPAKAALHQDPNINTEPEWITHPLYSTWENFIKLLDNFGIDQKELVQFGREFSVCLLAAESLNEG